MLEKMGGEIKDQSRQGDADELREILTCLEQGDDDCRSLPVLGRKSGL